MFGGRTLYLVVETKLPMSTLISPSSLGTECISPFQLRFLSVTLLILSYIGSLMLKVASNNYILSYYHGNVAISTSEDLGGHKVVSHDELSVTVR